MRSYWMSLSFVAVLISGYTAMVFSSHSTVGSAQQSKEPTGRGVSPTDPREPASAAQATTTEAAAAVN